VIFAYVSVDVPAPQRQHPNLASPSCAGISVHPSQGSRIKGRTFMGALASAVRTRHEYQERLAHARSTTDQLFQILRDEALYDRPIAERHRVIFYVGHVEAFDWNLLGQRAFGLKRFHPTFDQLFAFGIDPVGGGLPNDRPEDARGNAGIYVPPAGRR
jgi:hypothetical protein